MKKPAYVIIALILLVLSACSNNSGKAYIEENTVLEPAQEETAAPEEGTDKEIGLRLEGLPAGLQSKPQVSGGQAFVPLREFAELIGAQMEWAQAAEAANLTLDENYIYVQLAASGHQFQIFKGNPW